MKQTPNAAKRWGLVKFPVMHDQRGNLAVIEGQQHLPFGIERVYYLYDVPSGSERAGHAHRQLQQVILAVSGSFNVHLDDGRSQETIFLNRPHEGILLAPMVWRTIDNFSSGAVCLVLASSHYEEADYIRNYTDFQRAVVS